ncbi:MAG TPA: phenylacetate--CoA ligase family protein [candidate division Zixibacteria bacterium]|nr:phenylacetate--CoA ligase family protein [candidate division Zixibacteria bacterium]
MGLYNLFHSTLFRLKDLRDRTGVYRLAARLRREQFLPRPDLDDLRRRRLLDLLAHARLHSPYYRDLLAGLEPDLERIAPHEILSRIPLLTREIVQEEGSRLLCPGIPGSYPDSSGGSTGRPVNFHHDLTYLNWGRAPELFFLSWMGVRPGDRTAVFWGADRDLKEESLYTRLMLRLNRVRQLNSFAMSEAQIDAFLKQLNAFRPRYIYGYASSLYHVATFIARGRPLGFRPLAIRSSAEMLYPVQRAAIEQAFDAPVHNFYGSREVNNIAAECAAHDGLHIFASARMVEIVDDRGRLLPPGEVGHIAVTDLTNRAFPFIRYLNGDLAALKSGLCPCGRTYPRLEKIAGRSSDIITVEGRHIHGEYFTHLFYGRPEVKAFQLIQETEYDFRLLLVPRTRDLDTAFFRDRIRDKLGPRVRLEIALVDDIPPTAGGKHRFTVSKVPPRKDGL